MIIYVTGLTWEELAENFDILHGYRFIDIDSLIKVNNLKITRSVHQFVLNQEVEHMLNKFVRYGSVNSKGIIYRNSNMTKDTIESIKELDKIDRVICLDLVEEPHTPDIYDACDEVIRI